MVGRGRGKGKKPTVVTSHDDLIGVEEPLPAYRRRGRPQKIMKDETEKVDGEGEFLKPTISSKDGMEDMPEDGRKRTKNLHAKESSDSALEENGAAAKASIEHSTESGALTQYRNRRKSKPRRAAEAGVECK